MRLTSTKTNLPRYNRWIAYVFAIVITIILGLASRKFDHLLPPFVAENTGDMLWAMMVYFGFRFLLIQKGVFIALGLSFLFSFGIEFSQLYQADSDQSAACNTTRSIGTRPWLSNSRFNSVFSRNYPRSCLG